jgi:hypothetical protein
MKKNKDLEYYKNECENLRNQISYKFQNDFVTAKAAQIESERLYRKVGKKFVPVNDPYAYTGLHNGFWLVHVKEGCTSIRQQIYPEKAPLTAAARLVEDKLVDIIRKASEARPQKNPLTPEEKKDWDKFIAKHGNSFNTLCYPSFQENAEKIIMAIVDEQGYV